MQITDTDVSIITNLHDMILHECGIPLNSDLLVDARELWRKMEIMTGKEVCKCPIK